MAGNWDKFIDRSPIICAAGKPSGDPADRLPEYFKVYPVDDEIAALKHDAGIFEEHRPSVSYKLPLMENYRHCGIYTESKSILQPPVKTRYQTLVNDLKETAYESYWNKLEGRSPDSVPGLPAGMEPLHVTNGKSTPRGPTMKELINPPKTVYQVLWDSQVGHDMYKRTHNDYNTGEPLDRGYASPPFDRNKRYGGKAGYDPRGIWVRCACHWHSSNPISSVNRIQADSTATWCPRLGKAAAPNNNRDMVPKEHIYGKPTYRPMYGMAELLRDPECPPCMFKEDFRQWISNLNHLRVHLKKRFNEFGFDLKDFQDRCLYYDKENTNWIPLQLFYEICNCYDLTYQHECLEPFFSFVGVIKDYKINYRDFVFLVDINSSVPEIVKIEDVPNSSQYYISSGRAAVCDFLQIDNSRRKPAGVPVIRFDQLQPVAPPGGCLADLENLGDDTSTKAVVNPCIYTNYGLSYRDFFMPRTPDVIRKIFEDVGYTFPNDTFTKLWDIGVQHDKTGLVCIDTFKQLLKETVPPPKLIVKDNDKCQDSV